MGTVVQFVERLSEDGDWTPAERSQLRDMGSQLAEAASGLDLVFGKTEEGDPWAVVADQHSEVLLHIARIGGAFVVHAPANDQTVESSDLWQAVTRVVGGVLQRRRGLVLPFPPEGMGQQAVLALMVAAAVRGDFHDVMQGPLPGALTANDFTAAPLSRTVGELSHAAPRQAPSAEAAHPAAVAAGATAAAHATEVQAAPHQGGPAPDQAAVPAAQGGPLDGAAQGPQQVATVQPMPWARTAPEPGRVVASSQTANPTSAGGDKGAPHADGGAPTNGAGFAATGLAQGESASTTPRSEAQPDQAPTSGEAASGGMGGGSANHDVTVMAEGPIARGATGSADNFVLNLPQTLPANVAGGSFASSAAPAAASGAVSLGVVENFSAAEGDRFVLSNGIAPKVTTVTTLPEVSNMIPGAGVGGDAAGVVITGRRFGFDLNGDGREDAFVMVLTAGELPVLHQAASVEIAAPAGQAESSVTVTTLGIFIGH